MEDALRIDLSGLAFLIQREALRFHVLHQRVLVGGTDEHDVLTLKELEVESGKCVHPLRVELPHVLFYERLEAELAAAAEITRLLVVGRIGERAPRGLVGLSEYRMCAVFRVYPPGSFSRALDAGRHRVLCRVHAFHQQVAEHVPGVRHGVAEHGEVAPVRQTVSPRQGNLCGNLFRNSFFGLGNLVNGAGL